MGEEFPEDIKFRKLISNLASQLQVNKHKKWDSACMRDETGAVVCAGKKYIDENTHSVSGYVKMGGSLVFALGDKDDIKKLMETIGP